MNRGKQCPTVQYSRNTEYNTLVVLQILYLLPEVRPTKCNFQQENKITQILSHEWSQIAGLDWILVVL